MYQSYRRFIITVLLLTGWYLMLPPVGQQNGIPWPDNTAPVSRWTIAESFDTAKACETELSKHRKQFVQTSKKTDRADPAAAFWARFYVRASVSATCIATDDVRLRDSAEESAPNLKQSTSVEPPGQD
jgi:hypothetical protein